MEEVGKLCCELWAVFGPVELGDGQPSLDLDWLIGHQKRGGEGRVAEEKGEVRNEREGEGRMGEERQKKGCHCN